MLKNIKNQNNIFQTVVMRNSNCMFLFVDSTFYILYTTLLEKTFFFVKKYQMWCKKQFSDWFMVWMFTRTIEIDRCWTLNRLYWHINPLMYRIWWWTSWVLELRASCNTCRSHRRWGQAGSVEGKCFLGSTGSRWSYQPSSHTVHQDDQNKSLQWDPWWWWDVV